MIDFRGKNGKKRGFTMVEIMVAVGIVVVLATILIVLVAGMDAKAKTTRTTSEMKLLSEAIGAFKSSTGYYPLAVPDDAWGNWATFTTKMNWTTNPKWTDYFQNNGGIPNFTWETGTNPTNIHMLIFQLTQVPESNAIIERMKQSYGAADQKKLDLASGTEEWKKTSDDCQLNHPLDDQLRKVYQPMDAWGTPLRYWTAGTLEWSKTTGSWNTEIQNLLAAKIQQANWGFYLESAGPDRRFGWWGQQASPFNAKDANDNVYSVGK